MFSRLQMHTGEMTTAVGHESCVDVNPATYRVIAVVWPYMSPFLKWISFC